MLKNIKKSNHYNIRILIPCIICLMILTLSIVLCGCNNLSSTADKAFEEKYVAAEKKYEKYLNGPVSGQEVLDLIDNWDERDFKMTVEDLEGERFRVSNIDKENAPFEYWNKESIYYIDPNMFYEGSFIMYQNGRNESDKAIVELYFALVEDPSLSDDTTTENND